MRYTTEHTQATRRRILDAAARRFREDGFDGAGIASIMADAGLTHGGFGSHFSSKRDLIDAVIRDGFDRAGERLDEMLAGLEGRAFLRAFVDAYLGTEHCESPGVGCPFPPLAGEAGRGDDQLRAAFTEMFLRRRTLMWDRLDIPEAERDRRMLAAISQLIGAMTLARALDEPWSTDVRRAAADAAFAMLTGEVPAPAPGISHPPPPASSPSSPASPLDLGAST